MDRYFIVQSRVNHEKWRRLSSTDRAVVGWMGNKLEAFDEQSAVTMEVMASTAQQEFFSLNQPVRPDLERSFNALMNTDALRRSIRQLFEAGMIDRVED